MKLSEIVWPVYSLGKNSPSKEGEVLYFSKETKNGLSLEIIDDKSIKGNTLAERRLKLLVNGVPLFKIKYALFFIADLVKIATPHTWFIDSSGRIFQYKKKHTATLTFRKITRVIRDIGCSLIEVQGHPARFTCLYPPTPEQKYAGLLKMNGIYILYGFYEHQHKDTYRKI